MLTKFGYISIIADFDMKKGVYGIYVIRIYHVLRKYIRANIYERLINMIQILYI